MILKLVIGIIFLTICTLQSQTVVEKMVRVRLKSFFLLDIEPNNQAINLELKKPLDAGEKFVGMVNQEKWLNYTSALTTNNLPRNIYVSISEQLTGVDMFIEATASNSGGGQLGINSTPLILSTNPKLLLANIGRAYTGNGVHSGHQLRFWLDVSDYSLLKKNSNQVIHLTYTITP